MELSLSGKRLYTMIKAVGVLAVVLCVGGIALQQGFSQPKSAATDRELFVEIKQLSKEAKRTGAADDYYKVGRALARTLSASSYVEEPLGRLLADEQMAFQHGRTRGISEEKLLRNVNKFLGLDDAPEYLKLHQSELHRIRTKVWIKLPDITSGISKSEAKKGSRLFTSTLSPFEAYTAVGLLIYQKLYNDEYVTTAAERAADRTAKERKAPGLYVLEPNPRRADFESRLRNTAKNTSSVYGTVRDLLKESEND